MKNMSQCVFCYYPKHQVFPFFNTPYFGNWEFLWDQACIKKLKLKPNFSVHIIPNITYTNMQQFWSLFYFVLFLAYFLPAWLRYLIIDNGLFVCTPILFYRYHYYHIYYFVVLSQWRLTPSPCNQANLSVLFQWYIYTDSCNSQSL